MKKLAVLFAFSVLAILPLSVTMLGQYALAAGTSLGSKFECSGTAVFQNGAEVNSAKVKKSLGKQISKLKAKLVLARAQGVGKQKLQALAAQIRESKATREAIKACTSGSAVDPIWSRLAGQYTNGQCQDKVLGLTSNMRAGFFLSGSKFNGQISIDGFLGKLFGNGKLEISADVAGVTFPITLRASDTPAGDLDFIVSQDGRLQVILTNVPAAQVARAELNAQLINNDASIVGNFAIEQTDGSVFSRGSFSLNR